MTMVKRRFKIAGKKDIQNTHFLIKQLSQETQLERFKRKNKNIGSQFKKSLTG